MLSINFSQQYYLQRAAEMGLPSSFSHEQNTNGRNRHQDTRYINHESSVTDSPLAIYGGTNKYGKSKRDMSRDFDSKCYGGPITARTQNSTSASVERNIYKNDDIQTRKSCKPREWEWAPEHEIASESLRANEERDAKLASISPKNTNSIGNGRKRGKVHIIDDEGGSRSHRKWDGEDGGVAAKNADGANVGMANTVKTIRGDIVGGTRSVAPRGKSWMIVTQRMMEQYTP